MGMLRVRTGVLGLFFAWLIGVGVWLVVMLDDPQVETGFMFAFFAAGLVVFVVWCLIRLAVWRQTGAGRTIRGMCCGVRRCTGRVGDG